VRFVELLSAHIETTIANPELVALLLHERPEIGRLKGLRATKRRRDYARLFIDAYDAGVAAGQLSPMNSWVAVNTLLSAVNGASSWQHGDGERTTGRAALAENLAWLLSRGFLEPPQPVGRVMPVDS